VSSATTPRHDHLIAGRPQVAQHVTAVTVADQGSGRRFDDQVIGITAKAIRALSALSAVCLPVALVR
jgi:hypothetical protein